MKKTGELNVKGTAVRVVKIEGEDFVCLTDMAKLKSDDAQQTISNWMRNRMTIEYLGLWEYLYNPSFKPLEFEGFRNEVGLNSFTMSPSKWIEGVNAIGMVVQTGRYGGTYARNDIAFKFASWLSVEFELYLVKEFQRLKAAEQAHLDLKGNQRDYADINQLICISNMENLNAVMIEDGIPQPQRLKRLNEIAIHQMRILSAGPDSRNLLK